MGEEELVLESAKESESGKEQEVDANAYISAINEMKKNSVSRADYDKLCADNKLLLDAIINGADYEVEKTEVEKVDIDALRKELYNPDNQFLNLDFAQKTLKLRKAIMDEGGADPFLPAGRNIIVEERDVLAANRVADVLEQCIEAARGDSEVFTAEFNRRLVADGISKGPNLTNRRF